MATVKDVMTTDLHMIPANATRQEAAKQVREHDRGMLPVTEGGQIIAMITDRDIVCRSVAEEHDPAKTPVSMAMTPQLHYVRANADVMEAARIMQEQRIRRMLITDEDNRPVGVVSWAILAVVRKNMRRGFSGGGAAAGARWLWHDVRMLHVARRGRQRAAVNDDSLAPTGLAEFLVIEVSVVGATVRLLVRTRCRVYLLSSSTAAPT